MDAADMRHFRKMLQERLSVTLCTDNRLVSRTTVTAEYEKAVYKRDGRGSTWPVWQLNERRELQHMVWQT